MSTATLRQMRAARRTRIWRVAPSAATTFTPSARRKTCSTIGAMTCAASRPRVCAVGARRRPTSPAPSRVRRWLPLSLAATLLLAVAAVFLFGLNQSVQALAAGLTLDHVNCFKGAAPAPRAVVDAHAAAVSWQRSQGWSLTVPETAPAEDLRLVDVRRCLSPEGRVAHLMYLWRGRAAVGLRASADPRAGAHNGQHGSSDGDLVRSWTHLRGARDRPSSGF